MLSSQNPWPRKLLGWLRGFAHALARIRVRLLVVNLVVLLVPVAGLEFARIHERQLLDALQRDMRNQATLVRAWLESDLDDGIPLDFPTHANVVTAAAKKTRTRVRLLDERGEVVADSHESGPPEGPEPPPPSFVPHAFDGLTSELSRSPQPKTWPELPDRIEVKAALAGNPSATTRIRERHPDVLLFLTEPIRHRGQVVGVVYVVRSTQPVLLELYRIRAGLTRVLAVALLFTAMLTLLLAWSISRPLGKLSRAAQRVAAGEPDVMIPVSGGGEIRELAESFAQMKDQLDARLRYISQFAADVAHEFKSPLTSIRGAAELLEEGAFDDLEARRRFLRNISLDVARLDRLVSRLLELSRIEASNEVMTLVDLEALLERVIDRSSTEQKPIRLHYERQDRFIRAREMDLETALLNLMDNALRFSPTGKAVEVTVSGSPTEPMLRMTISDQGPGISAAHLPKVFDRFFTTDGSQEGTGLGLSIVQSVVHAHGGKIHVDSEPGQGATFTLELPARR